MILVFTGGVFEEMAKSSKVVAVRGSKVLLVRRRRDRLWMFPVGRKRARESEKDCLHGEILGVNR